MTLGTPGTDGGRIRAALVSLVAGLLLMLWAWGSWIYRTSASAPLPSVAGAADAAETLETREGANGDTWLLRTCLALAPIAIGGGFLLVWFARRSRAAAVRRGRHAFSGGETIRGDAVHGVNDGPELDDT